MTQQKESINLEAREYSGARDDVLLLPGPLALLGGHLLVVHQPSLDHETDESQNNIREPRGERR